MNFSTPYIMTFSPKINLAKIILLGAICFGLVSTIQAQISITISPVEGNAEAFLLQASGTGGSYRSTSHSATGKLFLSGNAIIYASGDLPSGIQIGGSDLTAYSGNSEGITFFMTTGIHGAGSPYSFNTSTQVLLGAGYTFSGEYTAFNPGNYTIIGSNGFFGGDSGTEIGTFTVLSSPVSPVPEPSSYALLLGLGAMVWTTAQRRGGRTAKLKSTDSPL